MVFTEFIDDEKLGKVLAPIKLRLDALESENNALRLELADARTSINSLNRAGMMILGLIIVTIICAVSANFALMKLDVVPKESFYSILDDVSRINTSQSDMSLQIAELRDRFVQINGSLSYTKQELENDIYLLHQFVDIIKLAQDNIQNYSAQSKSQELTYTILDDGTEEWRNAAGELHRDGDLPARIRHDYSEYYQNGLLHRENDKPARITRHIGSVLIENREPPKEIYIGKLEWFINGKRHRDNDQIAVLYPTFIEGCYYHHDKFIKKIRHTHGVDMPPKCI